MSLYLLQVGVQVAFLLGYINTKTGLGSPKVDFRAQLSSFYGIQILVRKIICYYLALVLAGYKSKCTDSPKKFVYTYFLNLSPAPILFSFSLFFSSFLFILGLFFSTQYLFLFVLFTFLIFSFFSFFRLFIHFCNPIPQTGRR